MLSCFQSAMIIDFDAFSVEHGGVLTPVPGRPFHSGQSAVFVLSLTTFPAPTCRNDEDEDEEND